MDIVVDPNGKVTFENLDYNLLYTYCTSSYKNFKVIPFKELTDDILKNHESIEKEYLDFTGLQAYDNLIKEYATTLVDGNVPTYDSSNQMLVFGVPSNQNNNNNSGNE